MDERLRAFYRQFISGDISAARYLNVLRRAGEPLELLDITSISHPVLLYILLGYTRPGYQNDSDVTTFGVWDFDETLYTYWMTADEPYLDGEVLLAMVPELASVFLEVGLDLTEHRFYLDCEGGQLIFEIPKIQTAQEVRQALIADLGLGRKNVYLRQEHQSSYMDPDDIPKGFKGRVRLKSEFLDLVPEIPGMEVTFGGAAIEEAFDPPLSAAHFAAGPILRFGIVVFEDSDILANSEHPDWRIEQMSEGKSLKELIEFVVSYQELEDDDAYRRRTALSLTNLNGDDINLVHSDENYYANFEEALADLLEGTNRYDREVIWLPAWLWKPECSHLEEEYDIAGDLRCTECGEELQ
jgi:hypothetical protein